MVCLCHSRLRRHLPSWQQAGHRTVFRRVHCAVRNRRHPSLSSYCHRWFQHTCQWPGWSARRPSGGTAVFTRPTQPTHRDGNTLDLIITRSDAQPSSCTVDPPNVFSDHSLVVCQFPSIPFAMQWTKLTRRPWRKLQSSALNASGEQLRRLSARSSLTSMTAPCGKSLIP